MDASSFISRAAKHAVLGVAFLAIAVMSTGQVSAAETDWRVVSASKAEVLVPGGTWQPLAADAALAPNSEVRVGAGGNAVLQSGGDTVTLSPHSQMMVPKATPGGPSLLQKLGTLLFRIEKRSPTLHQNVSTGQPKARTFNVETPYLAAVIKGTVFSINVSGQGAALHVTEGLVETISLATGERGLVAPGQTARVSSLPGAAMTISNGGKVERGNRATQAATGSENSNAGGGNSANAPGRAADRTNGRPGGLKAAVASGIDVAKSTKGLLQMASANAAANIGRGQAQRGNVPGRSVSKSAKTPGQLTSGLGNAGATPGVLPNGNTFHGNGNAFGLGGGNPGNGNPGGGNPGNGNPGGGNPGGNNGNNGCNGNGNKPGC